MATGQGGLLRLHLLPSATLSLLSVVLLTILVKILFLLSVCLLAVGVLFLPHPCVDCLGVGSSTAILLLLHLFAVLLSVLLVSFLLLCNELCIRPLVALILPCVIGLQCQSSLCVPRVSFALHAW